MGRPRKPTSLKLLDNDRKDRINRDEPASPPGLGEPPEWFDELSRRAWARMSERLGEMGLATRADAEAMTIYCRCYSAWMKASAVVAKEGMTVATEGGPKLHPLVQVINENQRQMMRILSQFGMTPSARAGLHVHQSPADDPLMSFLAGKGTGTDGKRRR